MNKKETLQLSLDSILDQAVKADMRVNELDKEVKKSSKTTQLMQAFKDAKSTSENLWDEVSNISDQLNTP